MSYKNNPSLITQNKLYTIKHEKAKTKIDHLHQTKFTTFQHPVSPKDPEQKKSPKYLQNQKLVKTPKRKLQKKQNHQKLSSGIIPLKPINGVNQKDSARDQFKVFLKQLQGCLTENYEQQFSGLNLQQRQEWKDEFLAFISRLKELKNQKIQVVKSDLFYKIVQKEVKKASSQFEVFLLQLKKNINENYEEQFSRLNAQQKQKWKQNFISFLKLKNTIVIDKNNQKQEILRIQNAQQDKSYTNFCLGNILQDQDFQQEFLYNIMTRYCGRIKFTKLIYIWSPLHKSNIHQYIDKQPNLLFIIRTEEDSKLAAFTEMPFKKPYPDPGFGALISLTNRKVFTVKKDQRAISYDGTYVSFGNYELLIKGYEISSNLGNAGGYYQSNGEKARILFNEGSKSATKIKQLQVFQILT